MKQYVITQIVYANSPSEAAAKARDGVVVNISLNEPLEKEEYDKIQETKEATRKYFKNV